MAGTGWRQWTRETLGITTLQTFLQDQVVQRYASASARGAALSTPTEGMVSYLDETDRMSVYDGTAWQTLPRLGDTGWVSMTPVSPWTAVPEGARYRVMNGVCYMQLGLFRNSGTNGQTVFTLPTSARPLWTQWGAGVFGGVSGIEVKVAPNGAITVGWGSTVPGGAVVSMSWPVID